MTATQTGKLYATNSVPPMKPTKRIKRVKGWAIVDKTSGVIECADYFTNNECPASGNSNAEAIYNTLRGAKEMLVSDTHKIVPCTITYSLPPKKK